MKIFFILSTFFLLICTPVWAKKKELGLDQICRAAISTIFDEKPEDIELFRQQLNVNYLRFPKNDKNQVNRFKCIVQGDEIIWATEMGAYRNTPIDSKITFEAKDNVLVVKEIHKNGSIFRKAFDVEKLKAEK